MELAVRRPELYQDIEVPRLVVEQQPEVRALGLQHAPHRRDDLLVRLVAPLLRSGEQLRRPHSDVRERQTLLIEIEHLLLDESRPLFRCAAFLPVTPDIVRKPHSVSLQQQPDRTRLADGSHPLPRPREPVGEFRQHRADLVQIVFSRVQLTHGRLPPCRQTVVGDGQGQQRLPYAVRLFSAGGDAEPQRLQPGLVHLLRGVQTTQRVDRGVELRKLLLKASHVASGQLSAVRQQRPFRVVGHQLSLQRDRPVLHMQPASREQRPARGRLYGTRIRRDGSFQCSLDLQCLLGKLRKRFAYLRPTGDTAERFGVRFRQT